MSKLCAVIPALNEERRVGPVVQRIRTQGIDVVVVDDGSADGTARVAAAAGATVIRHDATRGKGAALKTGFAHILDKGYDAVINLDADGQHDPDEIPLFIAKAAETGADVVLGSRMHSLEGMPFVRVVCNRAGSSIASRISAAKITDALIGFRFMKTAVLRSVRLEADRYEIDPEIVIRSLRAGFSLAHVDVTCIYNGQPSRIRPLYDGALFLRLAWRLHKERAR